MEEVDRYYQGNITLEEAENYIASGLVTAARAYVANGYYLRRIRDDRLYEEAGYKNFGEYVRAKYNKDKGWASKCIKVNQELSADGNSPILISNYQDYSVYQLVEIAYMTEEQREEADPDMTVQAMKVLRNPKPVVEEKVVTSQLEERSVEPEPDAEAQQTEEFIAISQQKSEPQPQEWNPTPTPCIHREGYSCTVPEAQKHIPGDGSNCGRSCCWECTKRGECKWECNSSQLRPEEPEQVEPEPDTPEIKPKLLHVYEDQAPDESWKFGDLPQAKEKYVKRLARVLVEKKGKYLRHSLLFSDIDGETVKWRLKDLAKETDQAIEIGDDVIAYPCAEIIEFTRSNEDMGICSYIRFETQVRKALEDWKGRQDSEAATTKLVEPDPVIDADYEEVPEPAEERKQIGELDLSCKTENILRRAGIDTVEGLASMSDEELTAVRGMSNRVMEEIKAKLNGLDSADKTEPEESMTDLEIAQQELDRANNLLKKCLKDVPDETNVLIRGMKLKVAALASFVCDLDDIENPAPKPEQPELPQLKNNDQRAAFVDAYETWPLWIETTETGERYYRYDLADGTSMMVKVYHARIFGGYMDGSYESMYHEGWGEQEYYLLKPEKFFRDCQTNRSTLIDKLKEIQKKERA